MGSSNKAPPTTSYLPSIEEDIEAVPPTPEHETVALSMDSIEPTDEENTGHPSCGTHPHLLPSLCLLPHYRHFNLTVCISSATASPVHHSSSESSGDFSSSPRSIPNFSSYTSISEEDSEEEEWDEVGSDHEGDDAAEAESDSDSDSDSDSETSLEIYAVATRQPEYLGVRYPGMDIFALEKVILLHMVMVVIDQEPEGILMDDEWDDGCEGYDDYEDSEWDFESGSETESRMVGSWNVDGSS
ncbi:uncharacterized protein B0T23DRAFT_394392 [Neurospora hispaniola]|uniref:Uncharacterized protein n=1 Tax=Neurospora hispaniola TaxID=588809 RepID=A0AAJ0MS66_9PEZI|nr:hypothetical protein B0T23DRAFT_394392 [Neurospora hispaniola]